MADQQDMFGGETTLAYRPKPEHVRNHLESLLAKMSAAQSWPWDEAVVELHVERTVPYLTGLLDDSEAADWRARFEAETSRLSRAA